MPQTTHNVEKKGVSLYFQRCAHVVERRFGEQILLFPLARSQEAVQAIYSLADVAAMIWEGLGQRCTIAEIASRITQHFRVEIEQAEADVRRFLEALCATGLVDKMAINAENN
jgi:hypothetical protein